LAFLVLCREIMYGCETWSLTLKEKIDCECCGGHLDFRGRTWRETGEDCIMRSFITCTLHQILLGW